MVIHRTACTVEEFRRYADKHPEKHLELWAGEIIETVTSEEHGKIASIIVSEIRFFLKKHPKIQGHYAVEASFRLPDSNRYECRPDVSFRRTDDTVSKAPALETMPDFVAEVKSPGNTYDELRDKARFYLQHGTQLVWLVYPSKRLVEVYTSETTSEFFLKDDVLSGEDVLPGFTLAIAELFDE
jgi:Uma2 family endonuclease